MRTTIAAMALGLALVAGGALTAPPAAAAPATGTAYRVDCSSRSAGDGTGSPWNSTSAVTRHGAFQPGDRILFRRGTTCKGMIRPTGSGAVGRPILIGAYGTGARPTIDGGGTPDRTATVLLLNARYWTVQDLHITNHAKSLRTTRAYRAGVAVINTGTGRAPGITIQRLKVEKVVSTLAELGDDSRNWGGIVAVTWNRSATVSDGFDALTIRDNVIDHVGRSGIMVQNTEAPRSYDRRVRVTGNRVSWTRGDGIVVRGSIGARIDHNVSANGSDMFPCPECSAVNDSWHANAGIWTAFSKGGRIDHNEVYGMRKMGGDGEAFDVDVHTTDIVFDYNYAHDNQGGGLLFCGSTDAVVRFNIFEDNQKSTFAFIGNFPAKNSQIYNNTIFQSRASGAGIARYFNGATGKGIKFYNNLVYSYAKGTYAWPSKVWSRANTYVGTHRAGEPRGKGYSLRAPGLRNPGTGIAGVGSLRGYRPVMPRTFGTGIAIPSAITRDFFGKLINSKRPPRGAAG